MCSTASIAGALLAPDCDGDHDQVDTGGKDIVDPIDSRVGALLQGGKGGRKKVHQVIQQ
jgi:hypothetical protein